MASADAGAGPDAAQADPDGNRPIKDSKAAPAPESPPIATAEVKPGEDETSASDKKSRERASKMKRGGDKADAPAKRHSPDSGTSSGDAGGDTKEDNALMPPSDGTAPVAAVLPADPGKDVSGDCELPDKDMARESWRRNRPTICPIASTGKAFILIPIKGPIEGETHRLHLRPTREARVVLPAGTESLLTIKQYKVRRLGFKELRVSATEGGGTRLRVMLQPGAGDPHFDVKDGYAKITVATPGKN